MIIRKKVALVFVVLFAAIILGSCASTVKFKGRSTGADVLKGYLNKPKGDGPFPAVVLLHGCAGIHERAYMWASRLNEWGYVTLIVDSLGPRGLYNVCKGGLSPWARARDAYDAKSYLTGLPFVDGRRIAVMGFSHGGASALQTAVRSVSPPNTPFRAALALYPYCSISPDDLNMPLLILIGGADDWTPATLCESYKSYQGAHEVVVKIYPGAHHFFDMPGMNTVSVGHVLKYDPAAAADANVRVRKFLAKHLR